MAKRVFLINFSHFFCDCQVTFIRESQLDRENKKKNTNYFLLLFSDLKFGKNSLICWNGYSHASFTILFHEYQVKYIRKVFTKEK